MAEPLQIPSIQDIEAARGRIARWIVRTPLLHSPGLSERTGAEIWLKMECWQRCGCFKVRGALSMVSALSAAERARGLVTCSSGNHGLSLAYAASLFGRPTTRVFVPEGAQAAKVRKIRQFGAEVQVQGRHFLEAFDAAMEFVRSAGATFVHSHDHPLVIAGQGTIGLEILEDLPEAEAVVVPVGGGGLVSGIATVLAAAKGPPRLIGAQSTAAPGAWLCFRDDRCHERIELKASIADGLSGTLTPRTFAIARGKVESICLVDDAEIVQAMQAALEEEQLVLEGSAAVGLAALLAGKLDLRGRKTVLVLTGRNIRAQDFLALVRGR